MSDPAPGRPPRNEGALEPEAPRPGGESTGTGGESPALPRRGCTGTFAAGLGVLFGGAYVANPTLGLFELLPDNFPLIGNLDEAAATTMLILGLQYLFGRRRGG